jgi:N-formylglutamate deformylase
MARRFSFSARPRASLMTPAHTAIGDEPPPLPLNDQPFDFIPGACVTQVVLSFPHVGLDWPGDFSRPAPQVSFGRNADYEVHALFPGAAARGVASVRARYSRLLIDLNRARDDVDPALVPDHPAARPRSPRRTGTHLPNRGVLWQTAVGNLPILSPPVSYSEFDARIRRYHLPYYRALEILLQRRRERFGGAILIDGHSMPGVVHGDLVLGTLEGGSCASKIQETALATLRRRDPELGISLDVRLNDPYRGGEIIRTFGRPEHSVHALQIEVNRALYMDEANLHLWPLLRAPGINARLLTQRERRLTALLRRLDDLVHVLVDQHLHPADNREVLASSNPSGDPGAASPAPAQDRPAEGDCLVSPAVPRLKST